MKEKPLQLKCLLEHVVCYLLSDGGADAVHHDHAGLPLGLWNLQSGNCLPHPRAILDDHERHLLLPLLADLRGTVSR